MPPEHSFWTMLKAALPVTSAPVTASACPFGFSTVIDRLAGG
jgi:hypothetical protein